MSALRNVKVIELGERPAGEYCSKLLADYGAQVLKIERPGGSPTRSQGPYNSGASVLFAYLNTNKHSVVLDLDSEAGQQQLHTLLAQADILIDDHDANWLEARGLSAASLGARYPSLVACSITPFGLDCPADWLPAESLNVFQRSGWGYHTPGDATPEQAPLPAAGRFLTEYEAALDAALCTVAAYVAGLESGRGEFIDIAEYAVMVSRADTVLGRNLAGEVPASDARDAFEMGGPAASFRCRDGYLFLFMTTALHWRALSELMGHPAWMEEFPEDWLEFGITAERVGRFREHFGQWIANKGKEETYQAGQKLGIPFAPFYHAADVYDSAQLAHRGYFQQLDDPALGAGCVRFPTFPCKLGATPAWLERPAPAPGSGDALARQWLAGPARDGGAGGTAPQRGRGGPLQGVRVLELTKVWAGPYAGKLLALLGAEVIKVESQSKLDEMRAYGGTDINNAPYFLCLNPEVESIQLDMKTAAGLDHLKSLVAHSDIVIDNLRPGVMEKMGLGFGELRGINPAIVAVSIKMFGTDGPLGFQTGFAPSFAALGGLSLQVGYAGQPPTGMNMRYGDATVGAWAAFGAVIALAHARRGGEGQFVDVSAVECMSSMIGDNLLAYEVLGEFAVSQGNHHPDMAPHGCYPCRDGQWLSLAVSSDEAWRHLCDCLGAPDLATDSRFASTASRITQSADLDREIATLTPAHDAETLAMALRAQGVAAARSLSTRDLVADDWLRERGTYTRVTDGLGRERPIIAAPWRLSFNPFHPTRGAPLLGEHNERVFCDLLGLSRDQLAEQQAAGILN